MANSVLEKVRGVGSITAGKLVEAGILSVEQLAAKSLNTVSDITGFPVSRVELILQNAKEMIDDPKLESLDETSEKEPKKKKKKKDKKKGKKGKKEKGKKKEKSGKKKKKKGKKK